MSMLDYTILVVVGAAALYGTARGALTMAASLLPKVAGICLAELCYGALGVRLEHWFSLSQASAAIASYVVLFAVAAGTLAITAGLLVPLCRAFVPRFADRIFGMALTAAIAAWLAGIGVSCLFPPRSFGANYQLLRGSRLAAPLVAYNKALLGFIPAPVEAAVENRVGALATYATGHFGILAFVGFCLLVLLGPPFPVWCPECGRNVRRRECPICGCKWCPNCDKDCPVCRSRRQFPSNGSRNVRRGRCLQP